MQLKYTGPEDQVNYEIGIATDGSSVLTPGETIEVDDDLGRILVAHSAFFEEISKPKKSDK